jgi:hypothetical protein
MAGTASGRPAVQMQIGLPRDATARANTNLLLLNYMDPLNPFMGTSTVLQSMKASDPKVAYH